MRILKVIYYILKHRKNTCKFSWGF